jgi:predicted secreted protein
MLGLAVLVLTSALAACGGSESIEPEVGSIEGTVALEAREDASSVSVVIADTDASTETRADGSFSFDPLSAGSFTLVISHPNFVTQEVDVDVIDDEVTTVDVLLEQVNVAPAITDVTLDPEGLTPGQTAVATVTATDANPDELTYAFEATNGFEVSGTDGASATITAPDQFDAQGELTVTVSDPDGASDSTKINLITINNQAPVIGGIVAIPSRLAPGGTADVSVNAMDADGDALTYAWSAPEGWSIDDATAADVQLTAPAAYGEAAIIEVTVTDEKGVSATAQTAVETNGNAAPVISSLTATPPQTTPGGEIQLEAAASDPDGGALTYTWDVPTDWMLDDASSANPVVTAPETYGASARFQLTVTDEAGATASSNIVLSTSQNDGPLVSSLTATPSTVARGGTIDLDVTATDPNGDTLSYSWSAPNGWTLDDAGAASPTLTAPAQNGVSATISVTVTDSEGLSSTGSTVVSTEANAAPTISSLDAQPAQTTPGGTISVSATASDANGDAIAYTWSAPAGWTLTGSGADVELTAPDAYSASGRLEVEASDGFGGVATAQISLSTVANQAPIVASVTAANTQLARSASTVVTVSANDPNGDALSYAFDIPNNADWSVDASTPAADNKATITASDAAGDTATLEVTVTDADGMSATAQLTLAVEPNTAPTISSLSSSQNPVMRGDTMTFAVDASDANSADTLTYSWSLSNANWSITAGTASDEITVAAPDTPDSTVTATVTVSDDSGATAQATTTVSTRANREPIITSTPPSNTIHASGRVTWSYQVIAQDADDSELSFTLANDGTTATIDPTTGLITWEPLRGDDGSYQFVVEVSDGFDTSSQQIAMTAEGFDFEQHKAYTTNSVQWAEFADLDGDGGDDIIGTGWSGSNDFLVGYWLSTDGHAQKYELDNVIPDYPVNGTDSAFYDCQYASFAELDGDGHTDMLVSCRYRRDAGGGSSVHGPYLIPVFSNPNATSNDDLLSLVSATGQPSVPVQSNVPNNHDYRGMDVGDVDGDGDKDVVASIYHYNGSTWHGRLEVYRNNGDGTLTALDTADFSNRYFYGLTMLDWDADGTSEVMVSGYPQGDNDNGGVYAFDFNADGTVDTTEVEFMPTGREATGIAATDFNGDGHIDVVLASRFDGGDSQDTVKIFVGDGAGDFSLSEKRDLGTQYCMGYRTQHTVAVGDYDADGKMDIALPAYDWYRCPFTATVLFGDGAGQTGERHDVNAASGVQRSDMVHTTDLNGDGLDDIATTDNGGMVRAAY